MGGRSGRWRLIISDLDYFAYGYDRNGNRQYRAHVNATDRDEFYTYDALNRLTRMQRGTLNGTNTGITGTPTNQEDWTLDPTGNWSGYVTQASGTADLTQGRTHNPVNEITGITEASGNPVWIDPAYDAAGNTTMMPQPDTPTAGLTATYDAWNRMRTAALSGGPTYTYVYDGLGRRTQSSIGGTAPSDYYYDHWRNLVQQDTGITDERVWGLRYIDELVCRIRTVSSTPTTYYAVQDANFNVTALTDVSGSVIERYGYTPYGLRSILDASFGARGSSSYAMTIGHQGLIHDVTGLIYNRARYLHPTLGRFDARDPLEYVSGGNLYWYELSSPIALLDFTGRIPGRYEPGIGFIRDGTIGYSPCSGKRFFQMIQEINGYPHNIPTGAINQVEKQFLDECAASKGQPTGPTGIFKRCQRQIEVEGLTGAIANSLGSHGYIVTDGRESGYGVTNTKANPGDLPKTDIRNRNEVLICKDCWKDPRNCPLKHGIGKGKRPLEATEDDIRDCIKNAPMCKGYGTITYNCNSWADDAISACGLRCL